MPKKTKNLKYYEAVGRRKSAVARVRLYIAARKSKNAADIKKGEIFINDKPSAEYFPMEGYEKQFSLPLDLTNNLSRFAVSVIARGGGKKGQMEAIRLGLARALEQVNEDHRPLLKSEGLLTRDARVRERRKPGTGGRARRKKQSPKR